MDWNDTPEEAAFRLGVASLIEQRLPQYYRNKSATYFASGESPELEWQYDMMHGTAEARAAAMEWSGALTEAGWAAPSWPAEYGGGGLSMMEQFILKQELCAAHAPPVGGGAGIPLVGPTILVHGTEEQKQRFLPKTLTGEFLWAQGYSEPGAGSDLASLQCRAVREGDEYVINGQKLWTSQAHMANWVCMLVRTDPDAPKHRGITFLLVDMQSPGITVRPIITMAGRHATNETFYDDVRVPADQVIGEVNRGWYIGMTLLDYERSSIAASVAEREAIDELVDHIRDNRSPHRTPLMRHEIAERYVEVEVGMNFSMRIASMQAHGLIPNYEASIGKAFTTELNQRIARTGTKVFGLYANLWDSADPQAPLLARHTIYYVSSVIRTIAGGSSEIQRNIIATRGLGLPRG